MAKLIPTLLLFFFSFLSSQAQNSKLIAANCHADGGRCSGTAYCTACSNCSGCKHCNSGGTCGVCTSYAEPVKTVHKKPAKRKAVYASGVSKKSSPKKTAPKKISKKSSLHGFHTPVAGDTPGDKFYVISEILSLREGPGTDQAVIETLAEGDALQLLGYDGEWMQVVVTESKNVGYVRTVFVK